MASPAPLCTHISTHQCRWILGRLRAVVQARRKCAHPGSRVSSSLPIRLYACCVHCAFMPCCCAYSRRFCSSCCRCTSVLISLARPPLLPSAASSGSPPFLCVLQPRNKLRFARWSGCLYRLMIGEVVRREKGVGGWGATKKIDLAERGCRRKDLAAQTIRPWLEHTRPCTDSRL